MDNDKIAKRMDAVAEELKVHNLKDDERFSEIAKVTEKNHYENVGRFNR